MTITRDVRSTDQQRKRAPINSESGTHINQRTDAPRRPTFRQAITSFMFDRDKGLVFEKLKQRSHSDCSARGRGVGMVDVVAEMRFRLNDLGSTR
jgi:hypothetical protein